MPPPHLPLSSILPPLILGTATFNNQYNTTPHLLPTTTIIHRALAAGITAFDTSPYYGPAEALLGAALHSSTSPRSSYHLLTKVGRISATSFDYTPSWIRASVARSLAHLHTTHLDVVYCHDVEFVTPVEVLAAVLTLRELRDEGKIRYIGISGYPVDVLVSLALHVRDETGEPLDAVMGYAHYSLQNTALAENRVLGRLVHEAGVNCVLSGSPLGMGLLRSQGVPIGGLGDFHPAPEGLRRVCAVASRVADGAGERLERVALRFALEGWARDGAEGGSEIWPGKIQGKGKVGVSVAGVSFLHELEELLEIWGEVVKGIERRALCESVQRVFETGEEGDERWRDYSWPSPEKGFKRESKL